MNRTPGRIATVLGAVLLCGSFLAHAQAPVPGTDGKDTEWRQQMRERMKSAQEACKGKDDRRSCMREQMCAKAADPAKCQADGKARMHKHLDARQAAHEACTGKRGDELVKCLGAQRKQHPTEHRK